MGLKLLLESTPQARERKFKNRAIARVIESMYPNTLKAIPIEMATEIVGEILTLDRQWRKLLQEFPHLRGKDYGDKDLLEQKTQLALGYEPGGTKKLKL